MITDPKHLLRSLAVLAIDYVRWTQLVPMLLAWSFLLLGLALMALVNFQEQGFGIVETLVLLWARHAWLPRLDGAVTPTDDGGLTLDGEGFQALVISGWAGISLILFLISTVRRALLGPTAPLPFRTTLAWLFVPAGIVWLCFVGIFLFGSEAFHGPAWQWLLMFTVVCGIVLAVSVYSLGVGALLRHVQDALRTPTNDARAAVLAGHAGHAG